MVSRVAAPIGCTLWAGAVALLLFTSPGGGAEKPLPDKLARWLGPQQWIKQRNKPWSRWKAGDFDDTHIFAPYIAKDAWEVFSVVSGFAGRRSRSRFPARTRHQHGWS